MQIFQLTICLKKHCTHTQNACWLFRLYLKYQVNRQSFTCGFAALLQFQRGFEAIFYKILWREESGPSLGSGIRKSHLRVESIVCPVQTDRQTCQVEFYFM